jgi:uncharacterized protein (TIGR00255 family)
MTGFGSAEILTELGSLSCEVRSVNSRYLDLTIRCPEEIRSLESAIRKKVSDTLSRGKVEVRFNLTFADAERSVLNEAALQSVLKLQARIQEIYPEAKSLTVSQLLDQPGVLERPTEDPEVFAGQVLECLGAALQKLQYAQQQEGEALARVLVGYCADIRSLVDTLEPKIPQIVDAMKEKLTQRLAEALEERLASSSSFTREEINDRIRTEVTLYATRLDVDEEMNRIRTHLTEIQKNLAGDKCSGKKLDFITQELNREANTLGSKSAAIDMTDTSIRLKVVIDQMREQIQNIA